MSLDVKQKINMVQGQQDSPLSGNVVLIIMETS